jgi:TetR/AcrR family transcriptional regulator, transcriptional repressor for nem operon
MKKRVRDPEGKRLSLLAAGMALAEQYGLANMSVNDVAAEAGVGKGSFYVHFPDRAAFLLELHRGFHEDLVATIRESCAGMAAGVERLSTAVTTYLDVCLREPNVRALLLDMRSELQVAEEIAARTGQVTRMFEQDLRAAGWPDPAPAARLFMAMCTETAVAEVHRGRRDTALRRSLLRYVSRDGLPVARAARR